MPAWNGLAFGIGISLIHTHVVLTRLLLASHNLALRLSLLSNKHLYLQLFGVLLSVSCLLKLLDVIARITISHDLGNPDNNVIASFAVEASLFRTLM